jgi:hypothetical protein
MFVYITISSDCTDTFKTQTTIKKMTDAGDYILTFGKYKKYKIRNVPGEYLDFLCAQWYDLDDDGKIVTGDILPRVTREFWSVFDGDTKRFFPDGFDEFDMKSDKDKAMIMWNLRDDIKEKTPHIVIPDSIWSSIFLFSHCTEAINAAREYRDFHRICWECYKVMPVIGTARANGVQHHDDWSLRHLHKKCFKELFQ